MEDAAKVSNELFWMKYRAWEDRADISAYARPGHYVERERVVLVIEEWLKHSSIEALSTSSGISERQIARILRPGEPRLMVKRGQIEGPNEYLTLEMVDRLFVGMDSVHLFYMAPEQGGFSDVYFHPVVMRMVTTDSYLHPSIVDEAA